MDNLIKIIGGDSGYVEIEIDESFTSHPSCRDIQIIEKNLSAIKNSREASIKEKRS